MNHTERDTLKRKIQELSFARLECQLFLDTHPECMNALEHFKKYDTELATLTAEYESKYGPLTPAAVLGDRWSWVDTPWPWQIENGGNG